MSKDQPTFTDKQLSELANEFVESPFGKHYLAQLALVYNALHQEAEREELTTEQKAMKVERAAGLRVAIDYMTGKQKLLQGGHFDRK